jgi:hypothetical protein
MTIANVNLRQVLLKRGNTNITSAYTGPVGEIVIDTTANSIRVQDGVTAGGHLIATTTSSSNIASGAFYANVDQTTGQVNIQGNLIPSANAVYSIGSNTQQWKNIYTASNVYIGNLALSNVGGQLAINGTVVSGTFSNSNVASYLPTYTGAVQASSILPNANVTANIGSSTAWFSNVHAITFRGTSTTAQYADLAEVYESDSDYEPGTVLVFGTDTEVTMSTRHEDNRVAGVVTTNPAYLMNSDATGVAVALQGRVPCRVVGTIRRGDMMVTSTTPGVATACMPPFGPHIGTVIGKALQNYDSSEVGVIEIVVGRV